jgi:hypothetical protein
LSEVELLRQFSRSNWLKDMISVSNELFTAFGYPCCVDAATKTKNKPSTKGGKIVKDLWNGWSTNSQFPLAEAFFKAVIPGSAFDVGGNGQAYPHVIVTGRRRAVSAFDAWRAAPFILATVGRAANDDERACSVGNRRVEWAIESVWGVAA